MLRGEQDQGLRLQSEVGKFTVEVIVGQGWGWEMNQELRSGPQLACILCPPLLHLHSVSSLVAFVGKKLENP